MRKPLKRLELVHFQLTKKCNLRCYFCGQWGDKGFFSGDHTPELTLDEWSKVIDSLVAYRQKSVISPDILLWGGEPLVYPDFEFIVNRLKQHGFTLGLVTNGVLLDRYRELIGNQFKVIYVSVDGNREMHDQVRGAGVFDKVAANIAKLRGYPVTVRIISVISPVNVHRLPEVPLMLEPLQPDQILLQKLIYLTRQECLEYEAWLKEKFNQAAPKIHTWANETVQNYLTELDRQLKIFNHNLESGLYKIPVEYLPHGFSSTGQYCLAAFRHLHATSTGEVNFCTDFYDFSAGNVRQGDLIDIFNNELSEKYRKEMLQQHNPCCNHCSWVNNSSFKL